MNLLYVGGYVIGGLLSARIFYTEAFKADYADSVKKGYGPEEKRLKYAQNFGQYFAWAGLIWPIAWPALFIIWFVTRPTNIERDIEKRKAKKKAEAEFSARVAADVIRLKAHYKSLDIEPQAESLLREVAEERVRKNEDID